MLGRFGSFDRYRLADALARAWVHGRQAPLKEFNPSELRPGSGSGASIQKSRGKVFVTLGDSEQILYFVDVGSEDPQRFFYVQNVGLTRGREGALTRAVNQRLDTLPELRGKIYGEMFARPFVQPDSVDFGGKDYRGLSVQAQLFDVPMRSRGVISPSLFENCYNVLALPAFCVLSERPLPGPDDWREF